jgi:hypothetical protein
LLAKYGQAYKIKHRINNKAISEQTNDIDDVEDEVSDENWSMSENSDVVLMRDSDIDKDSITDFNFTNDVIGFVDDYVIDEWNDYDEDYTINTKTMIKLYEIQFIIVAAVAVVVTIIFYLLITTII